MLAVLKLDDDVRLAERRIGGFPRIRAPSVIFEGDAARHTALTNVFSGGPARGIMNRAMKEMGPISDVAPAFPLATAAIAPLRAAAEKRGSGDFSPLWSGQNNRGCREMPAGELTRELAARL